MFPHLVGRNWHFFSLVWVSGTVSSNPVGWFFPQPLILSSHTCMIQYYTYAKYSRVSSAAFRVLSLSSLLLSGIMFGELELPWFTWTFSSSPHNPVSPSRSPPSCALAWKFFQGSELGQLQGSPQLHFSGITVICCHVSNVLKISVLYISFFFDYFKRDG